MSMPPTMAGRQSLSYSLTGGTDRDLFSIDAATGLVSFIAAPDFEAPGDAGGDNVYDIQVTVTDGQTVLPPPRTSRSPCWTSTRTPPR